MHSVQLHAEEQFLTINTAWITDSLRAWPSRALYQDADLCCHACSCYSLFLGFARSPVNFHAEDGSGYKFLGDSILKVPAVCAEGTTCVGRCMHALPNVHVRIGSVCTKQLHLFLCCRLTRSTPRSLHA